jgi:hypothetical protein
MDTKATHAALVNVNARIITLKNIIIRATRLKMDIRLDKSLGKNKRKLKQKGKSAIK